jgi:ribose-phosphate pyrophosphokinase
LETAGATRIITLDLHAPQIQGFFDIPTDQLMGVPILSEYFKGKQLQGDIVVVSPDHGGVTRARKMAERLKAPIAIIDKRRPRPNVAEVMNIVGNIEGKIAILIDDIIDTAGTITLAANALVENGAKEVYACCTHPVLSGPAIERIQNSKIKELVITNTINLLEEKRIDKIVELSVAPLIGEAIIRVHEEQSVSTLFD